MPYRQFKAMSQDEKDALVRARPNNKKRSVETNANQSLMNPEYKERMRNAASATVRFNDNDSSDDDDDDDDAAGNSFGRVGTQQHHTNSRQARKSKRAKRTNRTIRGFNSSERREQDAPTTNITHTIAPLTTSAATHTTGRFAYDAHTDTCCIGKGWTILEKTSQVCTVQGFSDSLPPLTEVPIVTAATAYHDTATDTTYILIVHQALDLGPQQDGSLICPNQLCMHGLITDNIP